MADLSADALMQAATNVFTVMAILYGLWFVVMVVIAVIVCARNKARTRKRYCPNCGAKMDGDGDAR